MIERTRAVFWGTPCRPVQLRQKREGHKHADRPMEMNLGKRNENNPEARSCQNSSKCHTHHGTFLLSEKVEDATG